MPRMTKKELVKRGSEIKPTIHVGKDGITDSLVEEVQRQIEGRGIVKVRVLPAAGLDKERVGMELSISTGATLVETRGFTILLADERLFLGKEH